MPHTPSPYAAPGPGRDAGPTGDSVDLRTGTGLDRTIDLTLDGAPRIAVWAAEGLTAAGLAATVRHSLDREPRVLTGLVEGLPALQRQIGAEADVIVVAAGSTPGPARQVARAAREHGVTVVWIEGSAEDRRPEEDDPVATVVVRRADAATGEPLRRALHALLADGRWPQAHHEPAPLEEEGDDDEVTAGLGEREVEVLRLLAEGCDTSEVAARLYYSERTVKNVVSRAIRHLGVRNRAQAVAVATRSGLL